MARGLSYTLGVILGWIAFMLYVRFQYLVKCEAVWKSTDCSDRCFPSDVRCHKVCAEGKSHFPEDTGRRYVAWISGPIEVTVCCHGEERTKQELDIFRRYLPVSE